jgi:hypothetical protein
MTGSVPIHQVVPNDHHDVNEEYRVNLLPGVTETEEKYGGITYHNGDGLNVCIPQNIPPRFLMTKISVSGYISEVNLLNESVLYEKEVSRSLSPQNGGKLFVPIHWILSRRPCNNHTVSTKAYLRCCYPLGLIRGGG